MSQNPTTPLLQLYLEEVIHKFQPKARIVWKNDSNFMKALYYVSFMFLWNPKFMTSYITVVGSTVYVPRETWLNRPEIINLRTLIHEGAHMYDNKKNPLWQLGYFFPQVAFLVLGIILAFVSPWFLFLCLGAALPLPAPFRFLFEIRGYRFNLMYMRRVMGWEPDLDIYQEYYKHTVSQMTDKWYFFAMPIRSIVERELDKWDGNDPYTRECMGWLQKENLLIM